MTPLGVVLVGVVVFVVLGAIVTLADRLDRRRRKTDEAEPEDVW